MPVLYNPTGDRLPCHRLQRILDAGERVEITEDEAEALALSPVFRVERPAPRRETVKRGGKRAEVTRAPERETR